MLDTLNAWLMDPANAYFAWQEREAEGANRRPFAARSVIQHRAMFDRFLRFLGERGRTVATFGPDHLGAFLEAGGGFQEDTATRIRYAKLVDRLCRHLVEIGLRRDNPGFEVLVQLQWPQGEPRPAHLSGGADVRLQTYVQPRPLDDERTLRNRAMVATLLATGVTAAEFLRLTIADVWLTGAQPYVSVVAHGPRPARTVHIETFALAVLDKWLAIRTRDAGTSTLLFPSRGDKPFTVAAVGNYVRDALLDIEVTAEDMSPRLLRNTDCRRQLLAGHSDDEVAYRLGLVTHHTLVKMRMTILRPQAATSFPEPEGLESLKP